MLTDVSERLASLGYTVVDGDSWVLDYISNNIESSIKKDCGKYDPITSAIVVPEELHGIVVDMVCGEFLQGKKASGSLTGFDLSAAVKSIQEGETTVTFAYGSGSMTPEQRLDALVSYLLNHGKSELISHRSMQW